MKIPGNPQPILKLVILVFLILSILFSGCARQPSTEELKTKFAELKAKMLEKKMSGFDITQAEELGRQAQQAYNRKDYSGAEKLLNRAFDALTTPGPTLSPGATPLATRATVPLPPVPGKSWVYDGAIYQTHPFIYANKSFKDITQEIPSLADMGIKTIFLMAIYEQQPAPPGEEWKTMVLITNYYNINTQWGSPQDLKNLVDTVHQYNMRIIFDLVTCCTPEGSQIFNNGWTHHMPLSEFEGIARAQELTLKTTSSCPGSIPVQGKCENAYLLGDKPSNLEGWVKGNEIYLFQWPNPSWQFAINRSDQRVVDYFTGAAVQYVRDYNIDGFRLDAPNQNMNSRIIPGDNTAAKIVTSVKSAITQVKPDVIFLAENPYTNWENTAELVYGRDILSMFMDKKPTSEEFVGYIKNINNRAYIMQGLENTPVAEQKAVLVLVSTIPGVPMMQVGQEIGLSGNFADAPIHWETGNYELRDYYKRIFGIRNSHNALKHGSIDNAWKSGDKTYAYTRTYGDDQVVVVLNMNNQQATSIITIPFKAGDQLVDEISGEVFRVEDPSAFSVTLPPYTGRILSRMISS